MQIWGRHCLEELWVERDDIGHKIRDIVVYETLLARFKHDKDRYRPIFMIPFPKNLTGPD